MSKKFDVVIGNPPYQGNAGFQTYPDFYVDSLNVADVVCMIFPSNWQEPKSNKNLGKMNNEVVKRDTQIVSIVNLTDAFMDIAGAKHTNIIMWQRGHDNGLDGKQFVINDGEPSEIILPILREDLPKPEFIEDLSGKVQLFGNFKSVMDIMSPRDLMV